MIGRKVSGVGPVPCPVLICGEGPGKVESQTGIPFSGASGAELEYVYLKRAARLRREDLYITNIVKWCTDEGDSDPTKDDIARDEPELQREIEEVNPQIIVAVGRVAASWFMQLSDIDLEKYSGVPVTCPQYPDKVLISVYHPAAGLYAPDRYYHQIYWDFEQVGRLVRGEIGVVEDAVKAEYRELALGNFVVVDDGEYYRPCGAIDTEGDVSNPWGMSYCYKEGCGLVVRKANIDHVYKTIEDAPRRSEFDYYASTLRRKTIYHNAVHDIPVLEALGVPSGPHRGSSDAVKYIEDTMLMAYLLPWLPRGLKPLAFKLCGMQMQSYREVIAEAEEKITREYLTQVLEAKRCGECGGTGTVRKPYKRDPERLKKPEQCPSCKGDGTGWPRPEPRLVLDTGGAGRLYTPSGAGRSVRALLQRGTKLREGWQNVDEPVRNIVEGQLGSMREPTLDDIPLEKAIHYSGQDADATLRVYRKLEPMIRAEGLWDIYEIDKGIIPIVHKMQQNGILIDRDYFAQLERQFESEQRETIDRLASITGHPINPASWKQVGDLLYNQLGLRGGKGSKGDGGTDEKTLETIRIKYKQDQKVTQIIDLITNYRELDKLLGTYIRALPTFCHNDGRIHSRFLPHIQRSGRISSRDPNLMQQPTRTERGRLIRAGFIPLRGRRLVSVDLDQIELRVAAHLSQDSNLISVFNSGLDIHKASAALAFSKPIELVTAEERRAAKIFVYGVLYGMSAKRLQKELYLEGVDMSMDGCVDFINKFFTAYPGLREFIGSTHAEAKAQGWVASLHGRRRYVQGVWSCVDKVREESLRWAVSHKVSATAAEIFKLFLTRADTGTIVPLRALPLVPVHDELVCEVEEGREGELIERLIQDAASVVELAVPIRAKGASGYNWSQLKG